jgi:hypothetical protein
MYDLQPHGQVGKAYASTFGVIAVFILASVVASVVGVHIFAAPFWKAFIYVVIVLVVLIFAAFLLTQARGGEG